MNNTALKKNIPIHANPPRLNVGEFWTARQRQASSLHEISYRACFKPQLPRYFIERFSSEGDAVYDPFMGRGTTVIEAALLKRNVIGNDINPLSTILVAPRLDIPEISTIERRLEEIEFSKRAKADIDISMFFHPETEAEIVSLQQYLLKKEKDGTEDSSDRWIRMVATNRLTGHSSGFFSVYTLPPNQATQPKSQIRINRLREQTPEYRNIKMIILKKTRTLLNRISERGRENIDAVGPRARFLSVDAGRSVEIADATIDLTITSPPFLDIVNYSNDNWLRCWFNGIDAKAIEGRITMSRTLDEWSAVMGGVFTELFRVTKPGGHVAFEVGEVRSKTVKLEEYVIPIGEEAGFRCEEIFINSQNFTKTANIWGIHNNESGTNTNRIVLFRK
ncbi:MAG TPA: DNA methyltransferase [Bacteroidota bacterium]|nr:DNA methyltransferase [Bacteroidota bacterium]